jgi:hypothetical protein
MDKNKARDHLAKAEKNVEAGKRRIAEQEELIKELAADGHKVDTAKETLKDFQKLEETMVKHRRILRDEVKRSNAIASALSARLANFVQAIAVGAAGSTRRALNPARRLLRRA